MNEKKRLFPLSTVPLLFCAITVWAFGPGSPQYIEGTVEKINASSITISKRIDPDARSDRHTFEITDDTRYKEFANLEGLTRGDTVNIEFIKKNGKNIAAQVMLLERG